MRCRKASLVINPRTGQNVVKLTDVLAVLAAAGWKVETALKEYGGHSMELANLAAKNKADLVISYGGDGTLSQVVNGVMNTKKRRSIVAVIPGGTANLWAGDIGVPNDPVQAALSLINSEVRKIDVGCVDVHSVIYPDGRRVTFDKGKKKKSVGSRRAKHYFLLMAGLGLDAAVMGAVSKPLKYRIGPLAIGLSAAKELPEQRVFPVEVWTGTNEPDNALLWRGDALQVIIGNTRRYAIILKMTPDAYIDDGKLDACIITGGSPLSTVQQLTSLLLRHQPDNVSAQFFRGAHLYVKVPASVPLELDGSCIKLKDYLNKSDYEALLQGGDLEQAMVIYRFSAMPQALQMAIPYTYDDELFKHADGHEKSHELENEPLGATRTRVEAPREGPEETESQARTIAVETQPERQEQQEEVTTHTKQAEVIDHELPELVNALLENGRKVTVVGKVPNPEEPRTYIIAGGATRPISNDTRPVAVVVNDKTAIFSREGGHVGPEAVEQLQQGDVIVVEGTKNKRGVIRASRIVL